MPSIYEQHDKAFAKVQAFVILAGGERIATVAIKFPADGAGRLYAYVHWLGMEMVRGSASGYGYDKRTAACADAAGKMPVPLGSGTKSKAETQALWAAFRGAMARDGGEHWDRALRDAGFTVWQAV
jgi:hypothetical protein